MADRIGSMDPNEMLEAATAVKDQVVDAARQLAEKYEVERRLQENPWAVLGIAAGAGFLLGGGLWPALKPIVKVAGRTAMSPSNLLAIAAAIGAVKASQQQHAETQEPSPIVPPTAH